MSLRLQGRDGLLGALLGLLHLPLDVRDDRLQLLLLHHAHGLAALGDRQLHILGARVHHLQQGLDSEAHGLVLGEGGGPVLLEELVDGLLVAAADGIRLVRGCGGCKI
jgi:hypothetical protein